MKVNYITLIVQKQCKFTHYDHKKLLFSITKLHIKTFTLTFTDLEVLYLLDNLFRTTNIPALKVNVWIEIFLCSDISWVVKVVGFTLEFRQNKMICNS